MHDATSPRPDAAQDFRPEAGHDSIVMNACTTHETRIVQAPAVAGAAPGSTTTTIRTESSDPLVIESDAKRDIIVKID